MGAPVFRSSNAKSTSGVSISSNRAKSRESRRSRGPGRALRRGVVGSIDGAKPPSRALVPSMREQDRACNRLDRPDRTLATACEALAPSCERRDPTCLALTPSCKRLDPTCRAVRSAIQPLGSTDRALHSTTRALGSTDRGLRSTIRPLHSLDRTLRSTTRPLRSPDRALRSTVRLLDPSSARWWVRPRSANR